jgi:hypothetical protein
MEVVCLVAMSSIKSIKHSANSRASPGGADKVAPVSDLMAKDWEHTNSCVIVRASERIPDLALGCEVEMDSLEQWTE